MRDRSSAAVFSRALNLASSFARISRDSEVVCDTLDLLVLFDFPSTASQQRGVLRQEASDTIVLGGVAFLQFVLLVHGHSNVIGLRVDCLIVRRDDFFKRCDGALIFSVLPGVGGVQGSHLRVVCRLGSCIGLLRLCKGQVGCREGSRE